MPELALFFLGTIVASFVGVVAVRLHTGESIISGRSRCDACNAPILPLAMVPVISYFVFGGRAQCCSARISVFAPLTEMLLGVLFVLSYVQLGFSAALPAMLVSLSLLCVLVLYDLSHQILPPHPLAAFVVASALTGYLAAPSLDDFLSTSVVALLISASLALIHFISGGRAMGFSDAPLALGLSLLVGSAALPGFIFSFWIGAVIGIVILLGRPRGSRIGVEVPFAPFLAAGYVLAYFTQWNPFAFAATLFVR
jgi:prepilin signal peptidase PulO-like enzyme (type II secretory pathway)